MTPHIWFRISGSTRVNLGGIAWQSWAVTATTPSTWAPDVLGEPYEALTLPLRDDEEGEVVATLVRRRAAEPTRRAVLYLHGFIDYFFQTHLADFFVGHGFDFYALDLRKYGRSMRPHQTANYVTSLAAYAEEIDAAAEFVRKEHDVLLVNGHSTGGLIAALWAHHRPGRADGLFLNSPFLDLRASWLERHVLAPGNDVLARAKPKQSVPAGLNPYYAHSIHRNWRGKWDYDLDWKPAEGFPVRAAWLAAIRRGQRAVSDGLAIEAPILVMSSTLSHTPRAWDDVLHTSDAILDAESIARLAPRLGRHVTIVRVEGGMHDLVLSADPVRARVLSELERWMGAYLPA